MTAIDGWCTNGQSGSSIRERAQTKGFHATAAGRQVRRRLQRERNTVFVCSQMGLTVDSFFALLSFLRSCVDWLIRFVGNCEAKSRGEQDHPVSRASLMTKKRKGESETKMEVFEMDEKFEMSLRVMRREIFGQVRPLLPRYTKVVLQNCTLGCCWYLWSLYYLSQCRYLFYLAACHVPIELGCRKPHLILLELVPLWTEESIIGVILNNTGRLFLY